MKRIMLAAAFVMVMAVAGAAQSTTDREHRRGGTLTVISGRGGPGFVYGYGFGGGAYTVAGFRGLTPAWAGVGCGSTLPWWGARVPWYWRRPVYSTYGLHGGTGYARPYLPMDVSPPPSAVTPRMRGVADRRHEIAASRHVADGLRRFKAGDYAAARDAFRGAVVEGAGARAEALFALALAATGDATNAEKALRSAAGNAPFRMEGLDALFRDDTERERVTGSFRGLVGAWVSALAGDDAKLRKLAGDDAAAARLLKK